MSPSVFKAEPALSGRCPGGCAVSHVALRIDHPLVGNQAAQRGVSPDFLDTPSVTPHQHDLADQPHAVAVIDVSLAVNNRQRLDRAAVGKMPTKNRDPSRPLAQATAEYDIFLHSCDKQSHPCS